MICVFYYRFHDVLIIFYFLYVDDFISHAHYRRYFQFKKTSDSVFSAFSVVIMFYFFSPADFTDWRRFFAIQKTFCSEYSVVKFLIIIKRCELCDFLCYLCGYYVLFFAPSDFTDWRRFFAIQKNICSVFSAFSEVKFLIIIKRYELCDFLCCFCD